MSISGEDRQELIREFLVESYENLDRMDRELVTLERDATARDAIDSIFRTVHTIKGTCGFLGLARLERVAHVGENLLGQLRDGELVVTEGLANALLETGDALRSMLRTIEATCEEGPDDHAALIARLTALCEDGAHDPDNARPSQDKPPAEAKPQVMRSEGERATPTDAYVRVNVRLLDSLMNLVGELVLVRNQMLEFVPGFTHQGFTASAQRLSLITTSIQAEAMKTRMQPIRGLWDKLPRVVRDLSVTCGKEVRLVMEGQDTELDRTIIESIKDPLLHLVRNCVDHGIENPTAREAAGKARQGQLMLRAFHEGGQVVIEIADDGAGLNLERIRGKALERGLIGHEQAAGMAERELGALIFLPGFSTAATVSNVSGRGVGMDVVKTNIERIGGSVDLQTRRGQGTSFRIKIPLTLAIVPALIVTSAGERFAIPQINLPELVRLKDQEAGNGVELIHGTPVYRLRGKLLPLAYLDVALGLRAAGERTSRKAVNIVVLEIDQRRFGLVIDGIIDTQEIVVKPLGRHLQDAGVFAGATIMGDGRVALILDVSGLAQQAGLIETRNDTAVNAGPAARAHQEVLHSWLLCEGEGGRRLALPLRQVARLEVFARSKFEQAGDQWVVQYRGGILPIIGVGGDRPAPNADPVHVVVHEDGPRCVGVMVDKILDVVEDASVPGETGKSLARCRTAILAQAVTELIDLPGIVQRAATLSPGVW